MLTELRPSPSNSSPLCLRAFASARMKRLSCTRPAISMIYGCTMRKAGNSGRCAQALESVSRKWADVPEIERLDLIRRMHHEISADMIIARVRSGDPPIGITLKESEFPEEIAAVCEAHGVDATSPRYVGLTQKFDRSTMRTRFLASVLRLADILDEAQRRALVEQGRALDLSLESRSHWWRLCYTRKVKIKPTKNQITIRFTFPAAKREIYESIIPSLQMPWIEEELSRHRPVMAEKGLSWHIRSMIRDAVYETIQVLPPEVTGFILKTVATQRSLAARRSRIDLAK